MSKNDCQPKLGNDNFRDRNAHRNMSGVPSDSQPLIGGDEGDGEDGNRFNERTGKREKKSGFGVMILSWLMYVGLSMVITIGTIVFLYQILPIMILGGANTTTNIHPNRTFSTNCSFSDAKRECRPCPPPQNNSCPPQLSCPECPQLSCPPLVPCVQCPVCILPTPPPPPKPCPPIICPLPPSPPTPSSTNETGPDVFHIVLPNKLMCDPPLPEWVRSKPEAARWAVQRFRRHIQAFARSNVIIMAESNRGFHDMAMNWMRTLRNLDISNFIIVCLDGGEWDLMQKTGIPNAFYDPNMALLVPGMDANSLSPDAQRFRAPAYNQIVHFKHILLQLVLQFGYNVFLSDIDIVFYRNPFPVLNHMPVCDFYAATESEPPSAGEWAQWKFPGAGFKYVLNTGLIYLRPTRATLRMMNVLSGKYGESNMGRADNLDDQAHFNHWFDSLPMERSMSATNCATYIIPANNETSSLLPLPLNFYVLHPHLFMSGAHKREPSVQPVTLHANYLPDFATKRGRLVAEGVWDTCVPLPQSLQSLESVEETKPSSSSANKRRPPPVSPPPSKYPIGTDLEPSPLVYADVNCSRMEDQIQTHTIPQIPVFVMWYYGFENRRERLSQDLEAAGFKDIRWYDHERVDSEIYDMASNEKYYTQNQARFDAIVGLTAGCGPCKQDGRLAMKKILVSIKHGLAYQHMIRESIPLALILEDDAIILNVTTFRADLFRYHCSASANAVADKQLYTALFIGNSFGNEGHFRVDQKPGVLTYRRDESRTADAYLMTLSGAKKTDAVLFPIVFGIDWQLNWVFRRNNCTSYWGWPALIRHGTEHRDYPTSDLHNPT